MKTPGFDPLYKTVMVVHIKYKQAVTAVSHIIAYAWHSDKQKMTRKRFLFTFGREASGQFHSCKQQYCTQ
jgi:hypothetical protein